MFLRRISLAAVSLLVTGMLLACGGGGGGGTAAAESEAASTPVTATPDTPPTDALMTLEPAALSVTTAEGGQGLWTAYSDAPGAYPPGVRVTGKVARAPDGPVFPTLRDDQQVFETSATSTLSWATDTVSVHVPFSKTLAAGTYTGQLKVILCSDPQCTSAYRGYEASIPYSVTVTPGVHLAISVNGVPVQGNYAIIRTGDEVVVVSTQPVAWDVWNNIGVLVTPSATATTWTARPQGGGTFKLSADTPSGNRATVEVDVRELGTWLPH